MRKYVFTLLLLIAASAVMAQKKSVINLIKSESLQGVKVNGVDVLKVYKATFQQDNSTLTSDSAYFHQAENKFDAFGHVLITQGDTMHIYSDKLNYDGNTKIALLTDNVRMVDKDATLTTNFLTYNTATKYGTYTGGGKLVNKDNTLTSLNGYYFANTRDAYFRYNVLLVTPDALIKTDTLRYNSNSRIAYFYGPTHIYGKKKGKDNDTLYTENGNYNTITEQAFFGKKNLYSQGTKTLKGDSMFYDRKKGYGRVVNNITFNDNEQKMTLKGDLGVYYKADERTVVTENAYAIIVTEEKDTSKNDSVAKKTMQPPANTQKLKGDTVNKPNPVKIPSSVKPAPVKPAADNKAKPPVTAPPANPKQDTTGSRKKGKQPAIKNKLIDSLPAKKDTARIKHDSVYMSADTLETRIMTFKDLNELKEKVRLSHIKDTTKRPPSIVYKKAPAVIEARYGKPQPDTVYLHHNYFGAPKPKPVAVKKPDKHLVAKKLSKQDSIRYRQDSIKKANQIDSVYLTRKIVLSDTARVRILSAFRHTKIFKSDLQGKSDSAFYSTSDSTIRMYVNPIIWTQGSQLSGDTVNLQMKNKKFDNMEMFPNAFVVNIEKGDSIHFNQVAGKKLRGFFKNDKLDKMYVDGNSETIYFSRDSGKVTEMQRSLSSRIGIRFKDSKVSNLVFSGKPEHRYGPLEKFTEEDKVLKGFLWKPKERPVSKESIIPSHKKAVAVKNTKGKVPANGKNTVKKPGDIKKMGIDTGAVKMVIPLIKSAKDSLLKTGKDTLMKIPPGILPAIKNKKDSILARPAIKALKDSVKKQ